jgi:hypothetical protein
MSPEQILLGCDNITNVGMIFGFRICGALSAPVLVLIVDALIAAVLWAVCV